MKWWILGLGQSKYKTSMKNLVVSKSKRSKNDEDMKKKA